MSPDRIRALRDLYTAFTQRVYHGTAGEIEEIAVMATQLAVLVPELLDEIETLQAEREEGGRPRIRTYKDDSRWGHA